MNVTKRSAVLLLGIMVILVMVSFQPVDAATPSIEGYYTHNEKKTTTSTISNVVVPTSSDRAIYVFLSHSQKSSSGGKLATDVDFNSGETFSKVGTGYIENGKAISEIWYLIAPTQTTADVVITWADNNANWNGGVYGAVVLSGVDQGTPDDGWVSNSGSGTSATIAIATTSGDLTLDVVTSLGAPITLTENGDGTEQYNILDNSMNGANSYFVADDAQSDLGWTLAGVGSDWTEGGVSINGAGGGTAYTAYPDGDLTLTGSPSLIADFVKTLIEGFVLTGAPSLVVAFVMTLIEGFTLAGTTSIFVIIQKIIVEGFGLTGGVSLVANFSVVLAVGFTLAGVTSLVANFSVRLIAGFSLSGSVAAAVAYVKTLIEGFSLSGTVTALKVLIVNLQESFTVVVGSTITTIAGVASMIYLLFFSVEMWGYLGPMAIVIGGYFVMTKDKNLGVLWFVVECLIMAQYFALLEATPDYWWHIIILLIGGLSTGLYSLGKR